jgi:hypothetical protein
MAFATQVNNYRVTLRSLQSSNGRDKNKSLWHSPIRTIDCESLPDLKLLARAWASSHDVQSSQWDEPLVFLNNHPIGFMSYSGAISSIDGVIYAE